MRDTSTGQRVGSFRCAVQRRYPALASGTRGCPFSWSHHAECQGAPAPRRPRNRAPVAGRPGPGGAQSDRGVITGRVSDPQSAIVVSAVVIARNVDTGAEHRTVTTATGDYTLSSLPARRYDLIDRGPGIQDVRLGERARAGRADDARGRRPGDWHDHRDRERQRRGAAAEDRQRRTGHQRQRRPDQRPAAELRRRRRQRRRHPQLARVRRPRARRVGHERARQRQRRAGRRIQDLPRGAGRHELERHGVDEHGRGRLGRDDRRVLDADRQLLGRVRAGARAACSTSRPSRGRTCCTGAPTTT